MKSLVTQADQVRYRENPQFNEGFVDVSFVLQVFLCFRKNWLDLWNRIRRYCCLR